MRPKNLVSLLLKLGFSSALIYWLISTGRFPTEALSALLEPRLLIWGMAMVGGVFFVSSERWRYLLSSQKIKIHGLDALKLSLVGVFFSFFIPGGVGGDLVKSFYIAKKYDDRKAIAIGSIIFDRIIGLFSMLCLALISILIGFEDFRDRPAIIPLAAMVFGLFFAFTIGFLFLWSNFAERFRKALLNKIVKIPALYRNIDRLFLFQITGRQFFVTWLLSVFAQLINLAFLVGCSYMTTNEAIPLEVFLFAVPLGFIATAIPLSPGGVGVGQAAFFFLFNLALGKEVQVGPALITFFQAFSLIYGLIGAAIYLSIKTTQTQASSPLRNEG